MSTKNLLLKLASQLEGLNEELKKIVVLKHDVAKSKKDEIIFNAELERLKKAVKMLSLETTKLDHIVTISQSLLRIMRV